MSAHASHSDDHGNDSGHETETNSPFEIQVVSMLNGSKSRIFMLTIAIFAVYALWNVWGSEQFRIHKFEQFSNRDEITFSNVGDVREYTVPRSGLMLHWNKSYEVAWKAFGTVEVLDRLGHTRTIKDEKLSEELNQNDFRYIFRSKDGTPSVKLRVKLISNKIPEL